MIKIIRSILLTLLIAFNCYTVSSYAVDNPDVDEVYNILDQLDQLINIDSAESAEAASDILKQKLGGYQAEAAPKSDSSSSVLPEISASNPLAILQTFVTYVINAVPCEAWDFGYKHLKTINALDMKHRCHLLRAEKIMDDYYHEPDLHKIVSNLAEQANLNRASDFEGLSGRAQQVPEANLGYLYHLFTTILSATSVELRKAGYYDASTAAADAVLNRHYVVEAHILALFTKSQILLAQQRYQECIDLYEQVKVTLVLADEKRIYTAVQLNAAISLDKKQRHQEALDLLDKILEER
ncbi:MAG: hypothetical protein OXC48_11380, partial [Endozoicomonadaceae bacterium]|nr:hypothetical protein [Endozoicomonadaceae bacterium]